MDAVGGGRGQPMGGWNHQRLNSGEKKGQKDYSQGCRSGFASKDGGLQMSPQ